MGLRQLFGQDLNSVTDQRSHQPTNQPTARLTYRAACTRHRSDTKTVHEDQQLISQQTITEYQLILTSIGHPFYKFRFDQRSIKQKRFSFNLRLRQDNLTSPKNHVQFRNMLRTCPASDGRKIKNIPAFNAKKGTLLKVSSF